MAKRTSKGKVTMYRSAKTEPSQKAMLKVTPQRLRKRPTEESQKRSSFGLKMDGTQTQALARSADEA